MDEEVARFAEVYRRFMERMTEGAWTEQRSRLGGDPERAARAGTDWLATEGLFPPEASP